MKLHSMKQAAPKPEAAQSNSLEGDEYPYGLRLELNDSALEQLGLSRLPAVGAEFKLEAVVCVKAVSSHESDGNKMRSASLQITDMGIEAHKRESAAKKMYGDKG